MERLEMALLDGLFEHSAVVAKIIEDQGLASDQTMKEYAATAIKLVRDNISRVEKSFGLLQ